MLTPAYRQARYQVSFITIWHVNGATYVVGLDEITGKDLSGTDTTVVWTLGTWETHLGPTEWLSIGIKESVLLLETEPWLGGLDSVH